jgi:hypothetical protein
MKLAALDLRLHALRRFGVMNFEVHANPPFIVAFIKFPESLSRICA